MAFGAATCLAVGALGTTLAANINLNGGDNVEFGQGVAQTTACSGGDSISVTPFSTFINEVGAGASYFTSVKLSNIPSNCEGKVFTIAAYGDSGSSLTLTNCSYPEAKLSVLFNGASTAQTTQSYTQMYADVSQSDATSFTLTWHNPDPQAMCHAEALSADVTRITVQSSGEYPTDGDYVADFTSGSTNFDSNPLVAFDANDSQPADTSWSNTGSILGTGDLTFNTTPDVSLSSNSYVQFIPGRYASGSVGSIATTADRMTVELWVNFDDAGDMFDGGLFSFDTGDDRGQINGCGYNLAFSDGYLGVNTCNGDLLGYNVSSLNNGWHHIVWIASTGARYTQKIYLDGALLQHLVRHDSGENPDLSENPRPNIGNGTFGLNSWIDSQQTLSYKLGALRIYAGEMGSSTVSSHSATYQASLP